MKNFLLKILNLPANFFNFFLLQRKNVERGENVRINGRIIIRGNGKISIGNHTKINSSFYSNSVGLAPQSSFETIGTGMIQIGNNVGISNTLLSAKSLIIIEDNAMLGGGVQIFDHDFHSIFYKDRVLHPSANYPSRPITIGEGVFIGTRSIVLKGTQIGARSVIGAGSVVSGVIPPNEIWSGNPAKFIKKINQPKVESKK